MANPNEAFLSRSIRFGAPGSEKIVDATDPLPVTGVVGGGSSTPGLETTNTPDAGGVTLAAATSTTLLAANADRIRFIIDNTSAADLYVRKAASAASASAGGYDIRIPAGASYISDAFEYRGEIRAFSTPGFTVNVSESV